MTAIVITMLTGLLSLGASSPTPMVPTVVEAPRAVEGVPLMLGCDWCDDSFWFAEHEHGSWEGHCGAEEIVDNEPNHEPCVALPHGCSVHRGCEADADDLLRYGRAIDDALGAADEGSRLATLLKDAREAGFTVSMSAVGVELEAFCDEAQVATVVTVPVPRDLRSVLLVAQ